MTRSDPYRSALTQFLPGALAAAVLVFAPSAAFAQRGAVHSGGSHFGGGSIGGSSHTSSASTSHSTARPAKASAPATTSKPRVGTSSATGTTSATTVHAPLFGARATSTPGATFALHGGAAAPRTSVIGYPSSEPDHWQAAPAHSGPMTFSGQGHEIWQDSPSRGSNSVAAVAPSASNRSLVSAAPAPATVLRPMPRLGFLPLRSAPIIFVPVFGYFGSGFGYGYFGNGFGCNPFSPWGYDPSFGCNGFGYGYGGYYGAGFGYDFGFGSGYDSSTSVDGGPAVFSNDDSASEYGSYSAASPSLENSSAAVNGDASSTDVGAASSATAAAESQPPPASPSTTIYLKDGTSYEVMSYWLDAGKLHYITNYGGETSIDMSQLDLQRTVDENTLRGANFTLRPAPATPAPAPDATPAPQQ